jgi:hypothetical protein
MKYFNLYMSEADAQSQYYGLSKAFHPDNNKDNPVATARQLELNLEYDAYKVLKPFFPDFVIAPEIEQYFSQKAQNTRLPEQIKSYGDVINTVLFNAKSALDSGQKLVKEIKSKPNPRRRIKS